MATGRPDSGEKVGRYCRFSLAGCFFPRRRDGLAVTLRCDDGAGDFVPVFSTVVRLHECMGSLGDTGYTVDQVVPGVEAEFIKRVLGGGCRIILDLEREVVLGSAEAPFVNQQSEDGSPDVRVENLMPLWEFIEYVRETARGVGRRLEQGERFEGQELLTIFANPPGADAAPAAQQASVPDEHPRRGTCGRLKRLVLPEDERTRRQMIAAEGYISQDEVVAVLMVSPMRRSPELTPAGHLGPPDTFLGVAGMRLDGRSSLITFSMKGGWIPATESREVFPLLGCFWHGRDIAQAREPGTPADRPRQGAPMSRGGSLFVR